MVFASSGSDTTLLFDINQVDPANLAVGLVGSVTAIIDPLANNTDSSMTGMGMGGKLLTFQKAFQHSNAKRHIDLQKTQIFSVQVSSIAFVVGRLCVNCEFNIVVRSIAVSVVDYFLHDSCSQYGWMILKFLCRIRDGPHERKRGNVQWSIWRNAGGCESSWKQQYASNDAAWCSANPDWKKTGFA